jgi:thiol:disulfide interchange protein DsbA
MLQRLALVAILLSAAACGGPAEEPAADTPALDTEGAETAIVDTELVATPLGDSPTTARFELGRSYLRLSPTQPTSSNPDQVEVCEVFWYGCPHCRAFDPLLERWRAAQPEHVSFVRVPAVWNPLLVMHARAFYTAEALGYGAEMHAEFFAEYHDRRNMLDTEPKLEEFFARFGISPEAFKSAFDSVAVQLKLQRADELSRRYRIESVPTMVVNGKYTTSGDNVGVASYEELLALVDELVAAEHEGR